MVMLVPDGGVRSGVPPESQKGHVPPSCASLSRAASVPATWQCPLKANGVPLHFYFALTTLRALQSSWSVFADHFRLVVLGHAVR